jgi:hypothetical protein
MTAKRRPLPVYEMRPDIAALLKDGDAFGDALRTAVRVALREHKRRGESIVVWQDGRVVTIAAEDIPVGT